MYNLYVISYRSVPFYFEWFSYLSWFRYGNEALLINQWSEVESIECTRSNATCPKSGRMVLQTFNFKQVRDIIHIYLWYYIRFNAAKEIIFRFEYMFDLFNYFLLHACTYIFFFYLFYIIFIYLIYHFRFLGTFLDGYRMPFFLNYCISFFGIFGSTIKNSGQLQTKIKKER